MTLEVLVVDDDDVDIMAVRRALRKLGVDSPVVTAYNGLEALDVLRGTNGRERLSSPFIIVLDLNMPKMGGLAFLEEIRRDPELRKSIVFVLTTSDAPRDKELAHQHNVAGYIVKSGPAGSIVDAMHMLRLYTSVVELP